MDDRLLLEQYLHSGSDTAFAELIKRYQDLVYSAALRQVRDPHLASDVAQTVFLCVARKAGALLQEQVLAGWLCRATRFESLKVLRERRRRADRELAFACDAQGGEPASGVRLEDAITPELDAALDALRPRDRDALVLRFLQSKSLREIATALGVSEDAAQKRLERAMDRLRAQLRRRGLPVSAAAVTLSVPGLSAAPPGLTGAVIAGLPGSAAAASAFPLVLSPLLLMTKVKIAAAAVVVAALTATPFIVQYRANEAMRRQRIELEAQHRMEMSRALAETSASVGASDQSAEIAALTAQVASLKAQASEPEPSAPAAAPGPDETVAAIKKRVLNPQNTPGDRVAALRELRDLNARDAQVAAAMATLAQTTTDPGVRADIFRQLSGVVEPSLKRVMLNALKQDATAEVRQEAAETLAAYGNDPEVYRYLASASREDADAEVREQAAEAMLKSAPAQILQQVLQDPNSTEAQLYYGVDALRKQQGPTADQAEVLLKVINGRAAPKLREEAVEDLGRHYAAVPRVAEWMKYLAESDADPRVQRKAQEFLAEGRR